MSMALPLPLPLPLPLLLLALLAILIAACTWAYTSLLRLRWQYQNGVWMRSGKVWIRRWYMPGKLQPIDTVRELQRTMNDVCMRSIGTTLRYPTMIADTEDALRKEFGNKIIMEMRKGDQIVAFHMAFISEYPHAHLGLIMVDKEYRGQGIQRLGLLNMGLICLDWFTTKFYVTDLSYSSSGWRLFASNVHKVYPNLYFDIKPEPFHYEIANLMMEKHRQDIGVSSKAVFDSRVFVIKGSNLTEGGGATELVSFASTRVSRSSIAQRMLEELMDDVDEQLYVGEANFWFLIWRLLPVESATLGLKWAVIMTMIVYHTLVPDLRWYYYTGYRMFGFELKFFDKRELPLKPAVWICNHYHWIDLWICKILNPRVSVVVKSDLMDEAPAGWKRECLRWAFGKIRLIFFRRDGKDAAVRSHIKKVLLQEKRPVLIFSEGTSQRRGPPMAMYPGAVEIARECNVPIQPICLRYNLPLGLDKKDDAMENAFQMIRLAGKKLGVHVLPTMDASTVTIQDVRSRITEAWESMGPLLGVVEKQDVGRISS